MLTKIRDDLVHPVMKMNVSMEAYSEAGRVGQWYVELLLLKLFDYSGSYKNQVNAAMGKLSLGRGTNQPTFSRRQDNEGTKELGR